MEKQRNLMFDSGAIKFLCSNKFDFNKLFREGISYQRLSDKELLRERLDKKLNQIHMGRFH